MAFEEMSGPRSSMKPKQVFASFDAKSSPAGVTAHRPTASLLQDTPPSIIIALSQLSPIIKTLNRVMALVTWTGEDNWSSFLLLSSFWLVCLYGDVIAHYAGNWILLGLLGIGYLRKKSETREIVHGIEAGENPITTATEDTQHLMDTTLYEIDCLCARLALLGGIVTPCREIVTWQDPQRSALIGLRLALITPLYLAVAWCFSHRALLMCTGTFFLTCTSPWFRVICTVLWRLRVVRKIASAAIGVALLPGESNLFQAFSHHPRPLDPVAHPDASKHHHAARFTTTMIVIENQRRWLGLGWTMSLLPHERAPFTDTDDRPGVAPEHTSLPAPQVTVEDGVTRTVTWTWIDSEWRVERDRGRDPDGWLYFDNTWHNPTSSEAFGQYTRRRKWMRHAECCETVHDANKAPEPAATTSRTIDPEKVKVCHDATPVTDNAGVKREWKMVSGGGRELVTTEAILKKRPFTLRRKSSRGSTVSIGVD